LRSRLDSIWRLEETKVRAENSNLLDGMKDIHALEAVLLTAATWFGSDGLGTGGGVGCMAMVARNHPETFKRLVPAAAQRVLRAHSLLEDLIKRTKPSDFTDEQLADAGPVDGLKDIRTLEEVILAAATWFGSYGFGPVGRMTMVARNHPETFMRLVPAAAKRATRAQAGATERDELSNKPYVIEREARAKLRVHGLPEDLIKLLKPIGLTDEQLADAGPVDLQSFDEVVLAAAGQHGDDGFGARGLEGFFCMLASANFKLFSRVVANMARLLLEAEAREPKRNRRIVRPPDLYWSR
jgi:hypothetical protein